MSLLSPGKARVNVIVFNGVIAPNMGGGPMQSTRFINIETYRDVISEAFGVKAHSSKPDLVVGQVNSPGGSPTQSHLVAKEMMRLAKQTGIPLIIYGEDAVASGGYMLACAGEKIYVDDFSTVGSIGVVASLGIMGLGFEELVKKWGLSHRTMTAGDSKRSSVTNPFMEVDPDDEKKMQAKLDELHELFKDFVRNCRGDRLTAKEEDIFNGETWSGRQALKHGLVDGVGTLEEAVARELGRSFELHFFRPKAPSPFAGIFPGLGSSSLVDDLVDRLLVMEAYSKYNFR